MSRSNNKRGKLVENNSLITQYFGADGGTEKLPKQNEESDFYKKCLMEKIEICEKNCHGEITRMQLQKDTLSKKLINIQKAQLACLKMCGKKDDRIKELRDKIKLQKSGNSNIIPIVVGQEKSKAGKILFEKFKDDFSEDQLRTLRSNIKTSRADSTFVLNCVRFSYSDELEKLQQKSLKGRTGGKEAISPIKMRRMESLFKEYLADMELKEAERSNREKKFGRHVHSAIMNITVGLKKTSQNKQIINV